MIDCIKRIIEKSNGVFDQKSARALLDEFNKKGANINDDVLRFEDALKEAKFQKIYESRLGTLREKRETLINTDRAKEFLNKKDALMKEGLSEFKAIKAIVGGVAKNVTDGKYSMDAQFHGLHGKYLGSLVGNLERADLLAYAKDVSNEKSIAEHLEYLNTKDKNGLPEPKGNDADKKIAREIYRTLEGLRAAKNEAGANIGHLDGYRGAQYHSQGKIANAGLEKWKRETMPLLDTDKLKQYGVNPDKTLNNMYDQFSTGKQFEAGAGNLADRLSQSRVLPFKDAESYLQYNRAYGRGTYMETIVHQIEYGARELSLLRNFGTKPRDMFDNMTRNLGNDEKRKIDNIYKQLDGSLFNPDNPTLAAITHGVALFNNLRFLGSVLFAHFGDVNFKATELMYQGHGLFDSYAHAAGDVLRFYGVLSKAEVNQVATSFGVGYEGAIGSLMGKLSADDSPIGTMAKTMRLMMKLNLEQWWIDNTNRGMAHGMGNFFGEMAGKQFKELIPETQNVMRQYGIKDTEWDIMRSVAQDIDGKKFIMPDAIEGMDNVALKGVVGDMKESAYEKMKLDVADRLRAMVTDRASYAQIRPGANERAITNQGQKAGSPLGSMLRLFMQFKQFPISVVSKVWGRALYGSGKADIPQMMQLVVGATIMGYVANTLKGFTLGKEPEKINSADTILKAVVRGGGGGIMMDALASVVNSGKFGSTVDALAGPTADALNEIGKMAAAIRTGQHPAQQAVKTAIHFTPGNNLFYLRPVLNYILFNQLNEMARPGYLNRLNSYAKKNNQGYFIPPADANVWKKK